MGIFPNCIHVLKVSLECELEPILDLPVENYWQFTTRFVNHKPIKNNNVAKMVFMSTDRNYCSLGIFFLDKFEVPFNLMN